MTSPKNLKVKDRVELERRFLSSILAYADEGDIREKAARYKTSWRRFRDKRHRAIWRALEALNLRSVGERIDILLDEDPNQGEEPPASDSELRADIGSAAYKAIVNKLNEHSQALAWLERELEAAGALPVVGGKKYLREVAAVYPVSGAVTDIFAEQLGFI
ncbi:MAG: hypothetical protein LBG91_02005 [Treponema sp.]|jgi:NAD-dependent DNA ligase|nr:hypothetical protein [Treponema sp.]